MLDVHANPRNVNKNIRRANRRSAAKTGQRTARSGSLNVMTAEPSSGVTPKIVQIATAQVTLDDGDTAHKLYALDETGQIFWRWGRVPGGLWAPLIGPTLQNLT